MGNADPNGITGEAPRQEFIGGAYCNYKVNSWAIPREQVKQVFAKKRNRIFPPLFWDVEIVTTDPSVWWTFWPLRRPEALLLFLEECGYAVDWTPHNWAGLPIE
jgi:hypothetical protein